MDRDLLPIQFEVDPGESCLWNHDEVNDLSVQRIELTHEDRLALLNQFLDLVDIPCPSVIKRVGSKKQPKMKNDTKVFVIQGYFSFYAKYDVLTCFFSLTG